MQQWLKTYELFCNLDISCQHLLVRWIALDYTLLFSNFYLWFFAFAAVRRTKTRRVVGYSPAWTR